jgi:hypothetical protein
MRRLLAVLILVPLLNSTTGCSKPQQAPLAATPTTEPAKETGPATCHELAELLVERGLDVDLQDGNGVEGDNPEVILFEKAGALKGTRGIAYVVQFPTEAKAADEARRRRGFAYKRFAINGDERLVEEITALLVPQVVQEKTDKLDEQAKAVAEKFTRAFVVDKKMDSVMKLVAVPYISISGPQEEKKLQVLNKVEDVRKQILAAMEGKKPITGKLTCKEVTTYEKSIASENPPEEFRKALDEVLKKSDRLVMVRVSEKEVGISTEVIVFVSWSDGEPKVV